MKLLRRWAFWLPLLAVINYIYELLYRPIKHLVLALDPLLALLFKLFDNIVYDADSYKILFPGFLIHFLLLLTYGWIIDCLIKWMFKEEGSFKDERSNPR